MAETGMVQMKGGQAALLGPMYLVPWVHFQDLVAHKDFRHKER